MSTIILVIVAIIAIAVLVDFRRSQASKKSGNALTANEALPTQTGRFRAQQALGDQSLSRPEGAEDGSGGSGDSGDSSDEDENRLPDPFDRER